MANKPILRDQRLRIMRGVLGWEGEIGNARVRDLFDVQHVQASRLLSKFREFMGDSIFSDSRTKSFRHIEPGSLDPLISLDEYDRLTRAAGIATCVVDASVNLTTIRPVVFSILRRAAIAGRGVDVTYASIENPKPKASTIFPHALVRVGRRWYVRAWCAVNKSFRTFSLSGISEARYSMNRATCGVSDDFGWEIVHIKLAAHRGLSVDQQEVVQNEYFEGASRKVISVRLCLVPHVIEDLRAAVEPGRQSPPDYVIEVINIDDLP